MNSRQVPASFPQPRPNDAISNAISNFTVQTEFQKDIWGKTIACASGIHCMTSTFK